MESLKQVIKGMIPNLATDQQYWINYFENHPELKELISKYQPEDQTVIGSLNTFYQYIQEKANCLSCSSVAKCSNLLTGHYSEIDYINGQFQVRLIKCSRQKQVEDDYYKKQLFRTQYIPSEILNASFKNIEQTSGRQDALTALLEFCASYSANQKQKGIYLYGPLGVGKSHMMAAAANKLAEKKIPSLMIYVPDFFREMKNSIKDNSFNEKIELLQKVQVLILDDIGAETISQWERDEILGAILQARLVNNLPTLYTSNLDFDNLEEHLAYSNKGGEEGLKAKRLLERIRHYTVPYFVDGPNRRI